MIEDLGSASLGEFCLRDFPLKERTAFGAGGRAKYAFFPENAASFAACIRISRDRTRSRYALFRFERIIALCKLILRSALASLAGVGMILWATSDSSVKPGICSI